MFSKKVFIISVVISFIVQVIIAQSQGATAGTGEILAVRYKEIPLGNIRPKGWLRNQMEIMRSGTTGHLDEVYAKIMNDNGWLGGKGDGWEETPYWLDGAVPLAYLLGDIKLKEKVLKYINWT